jgi:predicted enzyme related to lactoylglutathione lyase
MKPNFFDMTVVDVEKARHFFEQVFGWHFEKSPTAYEYYKIDTGPAREPGIEGGIGGIKHARLAEGRPLTQITVPVDDLEASLAKVRDSGGYVCEEKQPIPGIGWYAVCAEPGGLKFGLLQTDPKAA